MKTVSIASQIYIRSNEYLIQELESYEAMFENCTIMPREYYMELINHVQELQRKIEEIEGAE